MKYNFKVLAIALLACTVTPVLAQDFAGGPPIRMIVGVAAGGATDVSLRLLAEPELPVPAAARKKFEEYLELKEQGLPLAECLRRGAVCAAEIISHYGARPEADLAELVG